LGGAWGGVGTASLIDMISLRRLRNLLKAKFDEGYRCLACNDPREYILASRLAKTLGFQVIWFVHSPLWYFPNRVIGYRLLRAASMYADTIFTVSNYLRSTLISQGIAPSKVIVTPSCVDLEKIEKEARAGSIPENPIRRIGYLGRLARGKGIDVLLEAMAHVASKVSGVELVIAGEGAMRARLQQISRSLGIESQVKFLGFVDNRILMLASLDIFVNPSHDRGEVLPTNILEAFALERPVIATDHAAIPELVIMGQTGILVPKKNSLAIAQAILELLENPAYGKELGKRAREHLVPRYVLPEVVDQIISKLGNGKNDAYRN
jgi:glycosyltransferase involved in cell wall biosynthesis